MKKLLPLLFLLGCQNVAETELLLQPPSRPRDAGFVSPRDAGPSLRDAGRDPNRDAGVRDGGVVTSMRTLGEHKLFGTMPLDNMVLNPQFDQHSSLSFVFGGQPITRYHWPTSPVGLPVGVLEPGADTALPVQSRDVDLDVSVWIGALSGVPDNQVDVFLFGMGANGQPAIVPIERDATPSQTHENVVLGRWSARVRARFLGLTALGFTSRSSRPIFLTGPIVVPANSRIRPDGIEAREMRPIPIDAARRTQLEGIRTRLVEAIRRGI